jgi:putative transposase
VTAFRFVDREKARHHVTTMCRVLGVSPSGFWAWLGRRARPRPAAEIALTEAIRTAHGASRGTYGAPRIHAVLRAAGWRVSRKRIAHLMRDEGLAGIHRRRRAGRPQGPFHRARGVAPDLVRRRFRTDAPDRLWVADITDLPTRAGPLHLAAILDAFSRRVVGWAVADHLRTSLVIASLDIALATREPAPGLVHHSDRGTQYTSVALGDRLAAAGIAASMGSPGTAYDNAMAESFFASLETELIDRSDWADHGAARLAVFDWIERFYNRSRLHSALGNLSPDEFERRYRETTSAA